LEDDVRIERARRQDLPEIIALARLIWRASYPGIISREQIEFMLDWMYDLKKLEAELESGICFVRLMAGAGLVGFASFGPEHEEMKLHKIYIHPDWQRRGLGSRLLKHVETEAMARGFKKLILGVNKQNRPAIEAYQKNGFRIRTSIISQIGNGFVMDDYVMEKSLCRI
jgi:ribosomal protein S18 acetylase RimI-like enzyme